MSFMKLFLLFVCVVSLCKAQYQPNWESIDSRPLPSWYDEAKFGIFVHWGVYSVPSYGCRPQAESAEWYWWFLDGAKYECTVDFHNKTYGPNFRYADFGPMFDASLFDPTAWANLFVQSGAKYVVLTSKHHDGFCNWPSAQSWNWNSVDTGPHQDNVALLSKAVRAANLTMGLYFSLFEWFNPLYLQDKANNGSTQVYVDEIVTPQLYDIVNSYQPEILWSDGDWEMPDTYWKSTEFLAWLYNESPVKDVVVTNDRWGEDDTCKHGGYWTCSDRYNPGKLVPHKWENCLTLDTHSWGYDRNSNISAYLTIQDLLFELASTVSCGGNMLLNVGPAHDGTIHPIFQERLLQIGQWLDVNGESIYKSVPWRAQNDTAAEIIWYTASKDGQFVYAIVLDWPVTGILTLTQPKPTSETTISMLGLNNAISWKQTSGGIQIQMPNVPFILLPSPYAWVFKLENVL